MFVILSYPRSGTHLLAHLLNSHPDLTCYGEVLLGDYYGKAWGEEHFLPRKPISEMKDNEGCIIMYSQYLRASDEDKQKINNAHIIHLVRADIQEHINALEIAKGQKTTHKKIQIMRDVIAQARHKVLANKFKYFFPITYESICHNQEISSYRNDELCQFLGVEPRELTTKLPKWKKA